MQEAISEIIKFCKTEMLIKEINAHIYPENVKSIKIVEKFGFTESGIINYTFRGKEYPHKIYTLKI
jgi:RimJ/RimL family protein N-acetyltransferase